MILAIIFTILWSISPIGEARVGIPFAVANDIPIFWAFLLGLISNLLVFPLFYNLINFINRLFWKSRRYRQGAVNMTRKAKAGTKKYVEKYGFLGLMVFVMIPLPFTGAYMGTISAYVLRIDKLKAFWAVSIGVTISCIIVAVISFGVDKVVEVKSEVKAITSGESLSSSHVYQVEKSHGIVINQKVGSI